MKNEYTNKLCNFLKRLGRRILLINHSLINDCKKSILLYYILLNHKRALECSFKWKIYKNKCVRVMVLVEWRLSLEHCLTTSN